MFLRTGKAAELSFALDCAEPIDPEPIEANDDTLGCHISSEMIICWLYVFKNPEIASLSHDGKAARQVFKPPTYPHASRIHD